MNSKRKKKMMAATMALASIVSAKSKINAALNGDIQIGKKSSIAALNVKKSGKSLAPVFWSLGTIAAAALGGYLIYNFTNKNGKNPSDEQNPAEIGVDNTSNGSNTKKNQPKVQKKIWEEDPHGIIKFITWYGGNDHPGGSCIVNSNLNMLLNPVLMELLDKEEKNSNNKLSLPYWTPKIPILKKIWELSKKHEFIKAENPQHRTEFDRVYFGAEGIMAALASDFPHIMGTYDSISKGKNNEEKNPPLIFYNRKLENPDLDKASYKFGNRSYFVGSVTLRGPGHTVFAHLLYSDDGKELKRVIIQDPNGSNNNRKDWYVKEMPVEEMKKLLDNIDNENKKYKGYSINNLLMVQDEKFNENPYWKNGSLLDIKLNTW